VRAGELSNTGIQNYSEKVISLEGNGITEIDVSKSNVFFLKIKSDTVLHFNNIENVSMDNFVLITEQDDNSSYNLVFPSNTIWSNKIKGFVTKEPKAKDVFVFFSIDKGETWFSSQSMIDVG